MATESLSFDIWANDRASETFRRLGLSASNASGDVKTLGDRLDKLGTRVSTARVGLEGNKEAAAELDKLDVKLIRLGNKVADPNITVEGKIKAIAEISAVDLALDKLNRKTAGVNLATRASKLGALQPSLGGTALALSPSLIPLSAGIAAGIGAITLSLGAATIGAGAFGLLAKSALTTAGTAATAVEKAQQTYNVAIATGTKHATAYAAEQRAIKLAYAEMSPAQIALSKQVGALGSAWDSVQKSLAPVVSGALVPWLGAVTDAMKLIKPFVVPIAAVFKDWGQSLQKYFSSTIVAEQLRQLAVAFGKFSASQLRDIGSFLVNIGAAIFHLGQDLAAGGINFGAFGDHLAAWGKAFDTWSKSAQARADVQGFLDYLHKNGPAVRSILSDLGKILPGIFKGASTAGTLELQAISGFLGLIAKLPKGWQAPLTEAAGAMLLLSKTGVLKVGFTVVGAAAGWLKKLMGGASVDIGGTAAAAEMRAAMVSGGTAAAAEMRAAMTGGGAASAGEGAAAGGAAGAAARFGLPSLTSLAGYAAGAGLIISGLFLRIREDVAAGFGGIARDVPKAFSGIGGILQIAASGWADAIVNRFQKPVRSVMAGVGHNIASTFDAIRHNASAVWDDLWNHTLATTKQGDHNVAAVFDGLRHAIASEWDRIWSSTEGAVRNGIAAVVSFFRGLPGRALNALFGFGHSLYAFGHAALTDFLDGLRAVGGSVLGWLKNFIGGIPGAILRFLHMSPPHAGSVFYDLGANIMHHLASGIKSAAHQVVGAATAVSRRVADAGGGVQRWAGLVSQALSMEGLSPGLLGNVLYQMQTESGGNPNAINLGDINARMGDPSRGLLQVIGSTFAAYHWPGTSENIYNPLANIAAALNYARHVYGPSLMSGGMGIGSGHGYAAGSWNVPYTGQALIHKGEMVIPQRAAAAIRGGGGQEVVLRIKAGPGEFNQFLLKELRRSIRVRGGNVQVVLGRN